MPRSWVRFSSRATLLLAVAAGGLAACGDAMAPEPFKLPEEDLSTDPAALRLGDFWYPCGRWKDFTRPKVDYLLADLLFSNLRNEAGLPPEQRAKVEQLGAVILREWHLEGARVLIPTDSIPRFSVLGQARTVPDLRRYDTTVHIDFKAGSDWRGDSLQIVALGGWVLIPPSTLPNFPPSAFVILPNRAVPTLRKSPSVKTLFYSGVPNCA